MATLGVGIDKTVDQYMKWFKKWSAEFGEEHAAGLVIASAMQDKFKAEQVLKIVRKAPGIKEFDN